MLKFLKKEANMTHTENGAVTYRTTQSECLDLFATIGALRRERDEEITNRFLRAYAEDADLAMKTLFFARRYRRAPCLPYHSEVAGQQRAAIPGEEHPVHCRVWTLR